MKIRKPRLPAFPDNCISTMQGKKAGKEKAGREKRQGKHS
jgi:hypothetical protein